MSIELAVVAAAFLAWCLISVVWKSLLPSASDAEVQLIWREDNLHPWHAVPSDSIADDLRARLTWNIDDATYAALLDTVLAHRPPGTTTVQFAVVMRSDDQPTDVLFVSDVHAASAPRTNAVSAAPLLIGRKRRAAAASVSPGD